ncbi:hypothetical protein H072_2936 [Dactylellina haptotyla CBS 200.50]|uniref:G-protein coupled receptors family 1 profile domain-containing protein n=1 Tax=Dactylellina haptotyla (strain CBS 200.50) TaxID=1284197 RepID=S8APN5_DACHA|nr:hypothetical protein H072_2936 [Dactylellina haptotyla CBS 200.50]
MIYVSPLSQLYAAAWFSYKQEHGASELASIIQLQDTPIDPQFTAWAWAIGIANLVGSILSFFGSGFIAFTYLILPIKRHFRHSLILNLAIADFITSTNNSISGGWRLINKRDIPPGTSCTVNGFLEQLAVQATDTSILAIAIVTFWSLTRPNKVQETLPRATTILICCATWVLPIITACIALYLRRYSPVSGNWCWLAIKPTYYRYALMHGWRFAFIFTEIILYTYLHVYLRRRFADIMKATRNSFSEASLRPSPSWVSEPNTSPTTPKSTTEAQVHPIEVPPRPGTIQDRDGTWFDDDSEEELMQYDPAAHVESPGPGEKQGLPKIFDNIQPDLRSPMSDASTVMSPTAVRRRRRKLRFNFSHPFAHRSTNDDDLGDQEDPRKKNKNSTFARSRRVRRVLLLNAYPAMYILLWIPGIINRIVEASGGHSDVTTFLQASTQFIGLANALTYGWNERVGKQLREHLEVRTSGRDQRGIRERV